LTNIISFTIQGEPVAKARARVTDRRDRNGKRITYTPEKTSAAEYDFQIQAMWHRPDIPFTGPLVLRAKFYRMIPKSFSNRRRDYAEAGKLRPATKPDLDNLVKLVKDAMQGIFYANDSQIVRIEAEKWYSENPRIEIILEKLCED